MTWRMTINPWPDKRRPSNMNFAKWGIMRIEVQDDHQNMDTLVMAMAIAITKKLSTQLTLQSKRINLEDNPIIPQ